MRYLKDDVRLRAFGKKVKLTFLQSTPL